MHDLAEHTGRKEVTMRLITTKQLDKVIDSTKLGSLIYINSIGLTPACVDHLKELVSDKVLVPFKEDVEGHYKDIQSVYEGRTILPQCRYVKFGDRK